MNCLTVASWLFVIGSWCIAPAVMGLIAIPAKWLGYAIGARGDKAKSWREESESALYFLIFFFSIRWLVLGHI